MASSDPIRSVSIINQPTGVVFTWQATFNGVTTTWELIIADITTTTTETSTTTVTSTTLPPTTTETSTTTATSTTLPPTTTLLPPTTTFPTIASTTTVAPTTTPGNVTCEQVPLCDGTITNTCVSGLNASLCVIVTITTPWNVTNLIIESGAGLILHNGASLTVTGFLTIQFNATLTVGPGTGSASLRVLVVGDLLNLGGTITITDGTTMQVIGSLSLNSQSALVYVQQSSGRFAITVTGAVQFDVMRARGAPSCPPSSCFRRVPFSFY